MMDEKDLYEHLTMISNLADEVPSVEITSKDFMTTVCISIMGIPRYTNIFEIVMNGPALGKSNLTNKLTATEQGHKVTNERPPKLHTAMQALDNRIRKLGKKKKGEYYNCRKEGYFAKECRSESKRMLEEGANTTMGGRTEFVFTTQLGGSTSSGSNTWIVDSGASQHMVSSKLQLIKVEPLGTPTKVVLEDEQSLKAMHRGGAIILANI
jgi:hypothetical protein